MPKFNRKLEILPEIRADSTNLAGGRAFGQSPELEFASMLLTSFVSNQFYRKEAETLEQVPQLLDGGVPTSSPPRLRSTPATSSTCGPFRMW